MHPTAVLGTPGQGYEWDDEAQQWLAMPHFAGVVVGDDVEIGPACTVMRGVLQDTYIGNGSRIGNGVNIGHGARIGAHCLITAHCTVGGSAALGDKVVLWQNVSVGSGVSVGAGAVVGMGAVLLERVPRGEVWAGKSGEKDQVSRYGPEGAGPRRTNPPRSFRAIPSYHNATSPTATTDR